MSALAEASRRIDAAAVLNVAFCEACERLIFVRSLLDDPRHLTRRQGSAVTRLLRQGLESVDLQLDAVRPLIFEQNHPGRERAPAAIGVAVAALRKIHAHLGLLGTRWPLGTADLFVRKLVAEGLHVHIPTLCPTDHADGAAIGVEVGNQFAEHLAACGVVLMPRAGDAPILTIATMDLVDPLAWANYLVPLAAAMVATRGLGAHLRRPTSGDTAAFLRLCVAGYAARLIGEATFASCAARTLLDRWSGSRPAVEDIALIGEASLHYTQRIESDSAQTLVGYFAEMLEIQQGMAVGWGVAHVYAPADVDRSGWIDVDTFLRAELPEPVLPSVEEADALFDMLADGRPVNARPPVLPRDFEQRLDDGSDAEAFYALLPCADELPCSLATILSVGWRYKIRRTYVLCADLMTGDRPWRAALDMLSSHVLERCSLLQQSIEAAYVQQIFSRPDER